MKMTWDYIAGFFDGEGSIIHNGKGYRATISQTDLDVLERIKQFLGYGQIFKTTKRKAHWKESWVYYIARQKDVYHFLVAIENHLIVKQQTASKAIPILKNKIKLQIERELKSEKNIVETKKLRKEGLTYRRIGRELGISWSHARRIILKHGGSSSVG
ncbi:MAG: hypothetical protein UV20_C0046G0001 [Candidatus Magasanikbacteria bacterium GW2011_GWA2_42_32]|uniref:Homing endonuclease LAGLIDADG domain-containing protein n=1 Tax=Candidatus Magasanikbacteria bacterium GW2011_GWA2_42_32 TaxID=1619039 RepID=A0A0G0ZYK3_9BACT|nr:MAG: hypothetical protein UV20_C0046G0001 [Candidatus Magasanikbacteria bacterium GW2011_GWA2_42_32]